MPTLTLLRAGNRLASPRAQVALLEGDRETPPFLRLLDERGLTEPRPLPIDILQVNVGRVCNQTCAHCHVDAGPDRRESISPAVAEACLQLLERARIGTLDLTGGAPEMNPLFRSLVSGIGPLQAYTTRLADNLSLMIAVIVVLFWNFFANRHWTYNDVK